MWIQLPHTLPRYCRILGFNERSPKQLLGCHSFSFVEVAKVCFAGAPLFEGRWIPESGEIIIDRVCLLRSISEPGSALDTSQIKGEKKWAD
jgi:hypothetical protein